MKTIASEVTPGHWYKAIDVQVFVNITPSFGNLSSATIISVLTVIYISPY